MNIKFNSTMNKDRKHWNGFHGVFRLRRYFMVRMPRLYGRLLFRGFSGSKAAFREAITGKAGKCRQEYMYARYVNSWMEEKEEHNRMVEALGVWLHKENMAKLLDVLTDVFVFDGDIVIVTPRPGMWIGKMGSTVESLKAHMRENFSPDADILFKEINSPAQELRRIIDDIEYGDYGLSYTEFMECVDDYLDKEKEGDAECDTPDKSEAESSVQSDSSHVIPNELCTLL